ncbi:hypothetical protein ACS0TY_035136 [Phlomoides rotata]
MADKLPLVTRFISLQDIKTSAPATKVINNVAVSTSDVQIDPSHSLWFRLFTPSITDTNSDVLLPLIVYFHGGGFSRCAPDTKIYDDLCSHLAAKPAFGGEERPESQLRLGNVERIDKLWKDFLPEGADRNHPAVNVFGGGSNSEAAKEVKNLEFPPTLVVVGGKDALQDWDIRYVEWLKNCGKEVELTVYPDAAHAFYVFPEVPEFDLLFQRLKVFIHKHVHPN